MSAIQTLFAAASEEERQSFVAKCVNDRPRKRKAAGTTVRRGNPAVSNLVTRVSSMLQKGPLLSHNALQHLWSADRTADWQLSSVDPGVTINCALALADLDSLDRIRHFTSVHKAIVLVTLSHLIQADSGFVKDALTRVATLTGRAANTVRNNFHAGLNLVRFLRSVSWSVLMYVDDATYRSLFNKTGEAKDLTDLGMQLRSSLPPDTESASRAVINVVIHTMCRYIPDLDRIDRRTALGTALLESYSENELSRWISNAREELSVTSGRSVRSQAAWLEPSSMPPDRHLRPCASPQALQHSRHEMPTEDPQLSIGSNSEHAVVESSWRQKAETLIDHTPKADDWISAIRAQGLYDALHSGSLVSALINEPDTSLPVLYDDETSALYHLRSYTQVAKTTSTLTVMRQSLKNFKHFLVLSSCAVLLHCGTSLDAIYRVARLLLDNEIATDENCDQMMQTALFVNDLIVRLNLHGWQNRGSELVLLCKSLLASCCLVLTILFREQGAFVLH